jgi:hypothetical protein
MVWLAAGSGAVTATTAMAELESMVAEALHAKRRY